MSSITKVENHKYCLKSRPQGRVTRENFDFVTEPVADLLEGQILVRSIYLSLDPTNRIWMSDIEQYMPPVAIGEVMRGLGVGRVEKSRNPKFKEGSLVSGLLGWQEFVVTDGEGAFPLSLLPDVPGVSLSAMAGAAGMTGLTAYFGLLDVGQAKAGETLVVSAASGAVGSIVGQIGKLKGLKVVGIAGGEEKCNYLVDHFGFDAAVDYKSSDFTKRLTEATPDGVDINFENVGGEIMESVYQRMNLHSRFVLCGLISGYNDANDEKSRLSLSRALMKRIRIEGFIITDFGAQFQKATEELVTWLAEGRLKYRETIVEGLENAPEALNKLFDGDKVGKLLVKVSDENCTSS